MLERYGSSGRIPMSELRHRVLVPVDVLAGEGVADSLVRTLASVPVVLLGYHEVPEQTAPGQARMQFESRAQEELDALADAFEAAGGTVATRLVFTREPLKTFERIAVELECDAIVLNNPAPRLDSILMPLRGDINVKHIAKLVGSIAADTEASITLFHVRPDEVEEEGPVEVLTEAASILVDEGIGADRITQEVQTHASPSEAIVDVAGSHGLVVVGESEPSIRDRIFGDPSSMLAKRSVTPVLVVRRQILEMDTSEQEERVETLAETADEFVDEDDDQDVGSGDVDDANTSPTSTGS